MKIISWNYKGLGVPVQFEPLKLIRLENPDLVFLMETRLRLEEGMLIKVRSGFDCCQVVDCVGDGRRRAEAYVIMEGGCET
ncbi:unnamed protein product [Lathyrus sativus]|nr:unnamed protein product [Lathyrus sativus]